MKRKISNKEKILNAALKLIAEKGNLDFTIREVVLDAEVNIASVNYYFGTKKKLIQEIENKYIEKLLEIQKILKDTQIKPKERLVAWINTLFEYMLDNPGLISIFSSKLFITESINTTLELFLQENNNYLAQIIREITSIEEKTLKFKLLQINASLFFPMIFVNNTDKLFGFSFKDIENRKEYIKSIIDAIGIEKS
ncbi:MAG: TetR/AcrR family transcriptional regulator [Candidatus Heimdallarchaeaceae archaeon]